MLTEQGSTEAGLPEVKLRGCGQSLASEEAAVIRSETKSM
jgi:hypothetical protein